MLRRSDPLAPPAFTSDSVLAFVGGPPIQHASGPPASADPLENGYGFYFLWLTCPAVGREVRRLLDVVRPRLMKDGFPPLMSVQFSTGRMIVLVVRIAFSRAPAGQRAAARACHHAIVDASLAAGYPPARITIDGMDRLDPTGDTHWQVVRRLKDCLDPDGILAPGRYLPSASTS
jgi:4-cresol dehydrogenase (hydroxylating) flavoprotein subunit